MARSGSQRCLATASECGHRSGAAAEFSQVMQIAAPRSDHLQLSVPPANAMAMPLVARRQTYQSLVSGGTVPTQAIVTGPSGDVNVHSILQVMALSEVLSVLMMTASLAGDSPQL